MIRNLPTSNVPCDSCRWLAVTCLTSQVHDQLVACRVISKLTIKHVHTIPVTFKVILLLNPPNGGSQEKVALCHEDNTVTLTMYVWLLGHSIDDKLPQPLAHLPNSTIQPICPGKSK